MIKRILFSIITSVILAGCGSPGSPGSLCSNHGGVSLIEQGYIYCDDGTYFEEDKKTDER